MHHRLVALVALAALLALTGAGPARASFLVTFEAPGVAEAQRASLCAGVAGCQLWTETFEGQRRGAGQRGVVAEFGPGIAGSYDRLRVDGRNQFGSAGGSGNHAVLFQGTTALSLAGPAGGLNYFGLWWSALDPNNVLNFYDGQSLVFSYTAALFRGALDALPRGERGAYFGNPFDPPGRRRNAHEPYAFVNFLSTDRRFDRVEFVQTSWGGFESDNHTVGLIQATGGPDPAAVPAPAGLLLFGTALVALGAALARRRDRERLQASGW